MENTKKPDFLNGIAVDYYFEKQQNFRFEFLDMDDASADWDYIGIVEVTMGTLMGAP